MGLTRIDARGGQQDTPAAQAATRPRRLRNVFPRGTRYVRRMGRQAIHINAFSRSLHGIGALKQSPSSADPTVTLFALTRGSLTESPIVTVLLGNTLVQVPYNGVTVESAPFAFPWSWAELNNVSAFACKRGVKDGPLLHVTATQATPAGILAPSTGPTVGVGAAGGLTGTWNVFGYSFVTDDGHESNATLTFGNVVLAAQKFSWSALEAPTNPRVVSWRLYRGKVGASNTVAFSMTDIPITTPLPYAEDNADNTLSFKTAPITNLPPPTNVEHVSIWDERAFLTSNDDGDFGGPGWPYSTIDSDLIPQFEAFDADRRVLRIPPRGGQRAVCTVPWDGQGIKRLALFTDASVYVATPGAESDVYTIDDLDLKHGACGPGAACAAGGWLFWCDGRNVLASNGGVPEAISHDAIDAALADIPADLAGQIVVAYRRVENVFTLSIPSSAASTTNDLELWWSPEDGWSEAHYGDNGSGAGEAPVAYGSAPSGVVTLVGQHAAPIDLAVFASDNRLMWLDSPSLRDAGANTPRVWVEIEWPPLSDAEGNKLVVGQSLLMYQNRRDQLVTSKVDPAFTHRLNLDDNRLTSAVSAVVDPVSGGLRARTQNLGDPARTVGLLAAGPCEPALEFTSAWLDVAPVGARVVV